MKRWKHVIFILFFCAVLFAQDMPKPHIENITVPNNVFDKAQAKAQLISELRASIWEDHQGIINLKREAKIQELARKLRYMR